MNYRIELPELKCSNCGHHWHPRKTEIAYCPNCHVALSKHEPEEVE